MASNVGQRGGDESTAPVRLVLYLKKKEGVSIEEFHEYWSKKHAPLFLNIPIVQKNVLKYTQYHIDRALMTNVAQQGYPILDSFDGAAEIVAKDMNSLLEILHDREYLEIAKPDAEKFIDRKGCFMVVGHDEVKLDRT